MPASPTGDALSANDDTPESDDSATTSAPSPLPEAPEDSDASAGTNQSSIDAGVADSVSAPPGPAAGGPLEEMSDREVYALADRLAALTIDTQVKDGNRLVIDLGEKVQFSSGSTTLDSAAQSFLAALVIPLERAKPTTLVLIGHTDHQGRADVNAWLSAQRAEAVMSFLSESGLSAVDLRSEGRGETEPKAPLSDEWIVGPWVNRRIELELSWQANVDSEDS
jgi:outer membrane protein OmpA-like peptidoglycan-associated protein